MFPDSEIDKNYGCGRTKTSAIVEVLAEYDDNVITETLKSAPFSIATDGSTDMNSVKLYPLVV